MNDMEEANQKKWGGKFKDPPIEQEFKETKLSKCCGAKIEEVNYGVLGLHPTCKECESVWPEIGETVYQCSLCLEESETEECNCYDE